jgi:hypothetical protein
MAHRALARARLSSAQPSLARGPVQLRHRLREAPSSAAVARARPRPVPPSLARGPVSSAVACARPRPVMPSLARGPVHARAQRRAASLFKEQASNRQKENVSAALTFAVIRLSLQAARQDRRRSSRILRQLRLASETARSTLRHKGAASDSREARANGLPEGHSGPGRQREADGRAGVFSRNIFFPPLKLAMFSAVTQRRLQTINAVPSTSARA